MNNSTKTTVEQAAKHKNDKTNETRTKATQIIIRKHNSILQKETIKTHQKQQH